MLALHGWLRTKPTAGCLSSYLIKEIVMKDKRRDELEQVAAILFAFTLVTVIAYFAIQAFYS